MAKYQPGGKVDRQYGSLEEIRPDHIARYQLAAHAIPRGSKVADAACGCGYGSWILHSAGCDVTAVDISPEALEYGERHYKGPTYIKADAQEFTGNFDCLVTFETLEHLAAPEKLLKGIRAPLVIASVPNQELVPFRKARFAKDQYPHLRHYTPKEFEALLGEAGLEVKDWFCQRDKLGEIHAGTDGMFIIAIAER